MASSAALICQAGLVVGNGAIAAAFLNDVQGALEGGGVPLSDPARYGPLGREGFLQGLRLYAVCTATLAVFYARSGANKSTL